jgi:hypothetical protein
MTHCKDISKLFQSLPVPIVLILKGTVTIWFALVNLPLTLKLLNEKLLTIPFLVIGQFSPASVHYWIPYRKSTTLNVSGPLVSKIS